MPSLKSSAMLVALYLFAIVAANIGVARYGRTALYVSAFLLIPFDLCTRDVLHERWEGRRLALRMGLLIAAGSVLSFVLYRGAGRVAVASVTAFSTAAIVDTGVYQLAHRLKKVWKMNLSNLCSSITDSILFPVIAFGNTTFWLSFTQSADKMIGGIFWTALFVWWLRQRAGCWVPVGRDGHECGERITNKKAGVCYLHDVPLWRG